VSQCHFWAVGKRSGVNGSGCGPAAWQASHSGSAIVVHRHQTRACRRRVTCATHPGGQGHAGDRMSATQQTQGFKAKLSAEDFDCQASIGSDRAERQSVRHHCEARLRRRGHLDSTAGWYLGKSAIPMRPLAARSRGNVAATREWALSILKYLVTSRQGLLGCTIAQHTNSNKNNI
jgi:hypothetical protein